MSLEIYTWKSGSKGLGFTKPVKSMLFGGNVGHAAVELTFPADAKGDELAKKYQDVSGLSISKRTEIVPEKQKDGSYKPKEQVVYFVYFSWWPGHTNGHHINSHREDLESEWRHEPAPKIKPEIQQHLYGENTPAANKTNVTGILISEKTITKVRELSHQEIKAAVQIENDPAYQELKTEEAALQVELQQLIDKRKIYEQELARAGLEQRQPNKDLCLTDAEIARGYEINKELKRVAEQIKLCQTDFEERYLSVGEPPSSVIRMPTTLDHNAPTFALDTEGILDKMASLAQSTTAYSFYKFNCSTSATQVVKAGISDELKNIMRTDGFNVEKASQTTIATPTSFSHFSQQVQTELLLLNTNQALVKQERAKTANTFEAPTTTTQSFKQKFQDAIKGKSEEVVREPDDSEENRMGLATR
ncbi:hypothetical protein [Legionella pneumophila]|uniref:Coiled-coil protein n=1 Tax=Legionella pneumophila subsp. pascullei TaxID=91890 RepID=A0AAX2IRN4_LEGPN|nr:hypothetical protein [Legionella pneumophila]AMP88370.1 hypothetical protein AXF35_01080 [Legionella pneumophila subsp. pascullei]AMP91279.1 hypothetical protein AXF36_01080 [Legionella pneumophila subsp. pascullei]AMP94267.1 hypothetical protein AXF37_01080 [Legionella pneumophila subsp. pascullei]SQG89051.1 coiled-coil protein [Legionella pneumophila subsp. pascullei]VEH04101.1 coiled-coil protein [Legionella pneumophila subsp. pascullei]